MLAAWLWAPHPVACAAALLGCLSATLVSRISEPRKGWIVFALTCLVGIGCQALLNFVALADPSGQILARTGVLCWLVSHAVVFVFQRFQQKSLAPLECALFATPWVLWLYAHRQGHLDRPVGLMEPLQGLGVDPTRALAFLGISLGVALVLLLGSRNSEHLGTGPILFVIGFGLLASLAVPTQRLGRLATEESRLLAPGQVQERRVATTPVAVIVFYADYSPELEVFHFRPQPTQETDTGRPKSQKLRYRVAEIVAQDRSLVQGWNGQRTPVVVPDGKTFAAVYEIVSQVPTESLTEVIERPVSPASQPVENSTYQAILEEAVPSEDRLHPVRAALRIKLWMEQNRSQGEESSGGSVDDCLLKGRPVSQETFTRAAHQLLAELGFSSLVVSGYAARADQKSTGSFLLLTEQDRRFWLELTDPGVRGLEFDLYPLDGPNQSEGPQNLEMQRQLGELARARKQRYQPLPGLGMGTLGLLLFLFVIVACGHAVKAYRGLRARARGSTRYVAVCYRAVLDRLAEVEELRQAGETRYEFSQRLKNRVPNLEPLTAAFQRFALGASKPPEADEVGRLYQACLGDIATGYSRRRRWLGYLHPFSWFKVR